MLNTRFRNQVNTWPAFVDLFSNLVIVLIFLLIVFVFLWTTTSVFNRQSGAKAVAELKQQNAEQAQTIQQMTGDEQEARQLLVLARAQLIELENDKNELTTQLQEQESSTKDLVSAYETQVNDLQARLDSLNRQLAQAQLTRSETEKLAQERRELQDQMAAQRAQLSEQLSAVQAALDAAEEKSRTQEIKYVEMSTRLNKALADKVAELNDASNYQSEFYRAIKEAIGDRTTIRNDGDRFIISSDILFPSGSYTLSVDGKNQLRLIANVIKDLEHKIPSNIDWIIRVDGHTDKKPVIAGTRGYRNNVQLSLRRATVVADELARNGVSRRRLVPSGFGDLHPVELGNDAASLQKNRRIELRLTNK